MSVQSLSNTQVKKKILKAKVKQNKILLLTKTNKQTSRKGI